MRPRHRLTLVALALALVGAGSAHVYRNDAMHVRAFAAPLGWELAPQASYPRLLASYSHQDGGKLTLAGQKAPPRATALALAEQSRTPLERQGFASIKIARDGDRATIDATLDGGRRFMKQVYLVAGGYAFVVTLIAPVAAAAHATPDFDEAVRSLQLTDTASPDGNAAR